ncbi:hypothetical protein ACFFHM_18520 [Halalkalibacter kiskunsagensis]|uniref:Phosphoglyceromutase n=1 Tax=Halalkalibacter kiskunsagensis TaxID=1548599 RepID=A0ABV6KHK9_9BACI
MFVVICLLFPLHVDSYALEKDEMEEVLVILVPGMSFMEAEWLINNDKNTTLWQEAAIGAMNVRPDGPYSYLNNMVTMAAGAKAVGVQEWNSYEVGEEVKGIEVSEWVHQLTGTKRMTGLMHPNFHRLNQKNNEGTRGGQVGEFGELLKQAGVDRKVYGHSNTIEEEIRYGSLLAVDKQGEVSGELHQAVKSVPGAPKGIEMDSDYLINKLSTEEEKSKQFVVIEWGDLYRLYDQKYYIEDAHFIEEQSRQLLRLSSFIDRAKQEVNEVWLLAPMMHKKAYEDKQQLAPTFYWGEEKGGYLTSSTTRQDYVISSIDVIPTLLSAYNLPTDQFAGNSIVRQNVGTVDKSPVLKKVNEIVLIYKSRASVLSIYISCLVVALLGAAIYGFFGMKKRQTWRYLTRLILLSALWSPFWFLALSTMVKTVGVTGFVLVLIASAFLCGYVVEKIGNSPIFWIGMMTFLLITVDILLGSPMMQRSYLGYDPIIGARYYGIGNEFAGVYLISAIMVLSPLLVNQQKKVLILCTTIMFAVVVVMLGKSTLGTNAGATLSAGLAFAFLLYRSFFTTWSWRLVMVLFSVASVGLFFLLYMLQLAGEQTHIGMAFERLLNGDVRYITDTIQRKLAMNMKIFRHSNWTQLFVTSYLLGAIILWRRRLQLIEYDKQLFLQTGVVASFTLLMLNDSGVVAAATSMFCVVSAHYYWLSVNKEEKDFAVGKTINPSQAVED